MHSNRRFKSDAFAAVHAAAAGMYRAATIDYPFAGTLMLNC
jgi:hypothetical protein